jgi:CBS domain-containing protein
MAPISKSLLSLTASDLMSASVVMIPEEMSLQGAAHLLAQAHVSGVPVVNHEGRCVGVLSSTDFVRWVEKKRPGQRAHADHSSFCSVWQIVDPAELPADAVRNFMTHDPVMVSRTTSIGAIARTMVDAHIHRVIVIDHRGNPEGIVSTTDVLAALARADQARATSTEAEEHQTTVSC